MERLPPLQALYYFYIAAKLGSFKSAAQQLFVSAAAISQQIRQLEEHLETPLFHRQHRKVTLTPAGEALFDHAQKGFEHLQQGVQQLNQDPAPHQLSLSTLPSFAQHWLVPRIGHFHQLNPELSLMMEPNNTLTDFQHSQIDLCIRYGPGKYAGLQSQLLMREVLYPVCHPIYQEKHGIYQLSDLSRADLIEDYWKDMDWQIWLNNLGLKANKPSLKYNGSHFVIEGALAVQGVGLTKHALAQRYINEGKLVRIGDIAQATDYDYYLCAPKAYFQRQKVKIFCDWLFQQVDEFEAATPKDFKILSFPTTSA